ncbi:class I glutamine amidotransferase-like protein [Basidiobolus meristosporus CBS 931.73]|uniref:D-lactate dehydratase n=1 Tax=Basidiobolus meristosporus CBS 931.73 TaxID=1314790 RepID=A0A1Y1VTS9_9FUNG|nr:class I glutamine amidotransferase-like protein [Basidiobolus meristosporus CBS 931.73]|eukprot:ORX64426.1 class I glutamine amidotransferase-like protein [Basidiobolus meristosporus CBS 931.73]
MRLHQPVMQLSFLLLVSAIASLQAISATPLGDSQDTSVPSQEYQPSTEEGDDSEMSAPMQTSETPGEQPGFSGLQGFDISNLQPSQALLDNINGHSASKANALSNSNQFDQAQVIDQTLYQPKQQQPHIIITQPAARALRGGYKKYKRSARRHFKFLDWEYPMNETNYQVDDSETSVSPNSIPNGVMGYCNGEDGAYGSTYQLYYPKINQCYNISPKPNVGVMNFSPFAENTFCFFSEANCRGERVCVYRSLSNPSSDGLIVPATTNMLSNGILTNLPRRALLAITSYNEPFYANGSKTGLFYTEALHPYEALVEAGFEVDFASETGTYGVDEHSLSKDFLSEDDQKLNSQLYKAEDLNPADYGLFFASAGHRNPHIAEDIYKRGGVVSAVCHGPAILPGIMDSTTVLIKSANVATIEEGAAAVGAEYVAPPTPFADFTQTDGRVVTGANPASAKSTAVNAIKVFSSL